MLSHCWVFWLASFGNHTSTLTNVWFWRFRVVFMFHISKEMLNVYQLQALINCPDFFVHWAAGTKTSICISVSALSSCCGRSTWDRKRDFGFGGVWQWLWASSLLGWGLPVNFASCSHYGSRKVLDWLLFRALKQFLTVTLSISDFLIIIFSAS